MTGRTRSHRPLAWLIPCVLASAVACTGDGPEGAGSAVRPFSPDPFAVEILTEADALAGPRSEDVHRLFDGWSPVTVGGRKGFRASREGASLQVTTVGMAERRLVIDLLDDGRLARLSRVHVRLDGGEAVPVPVIDPLTIPLREDLDTGRHLVEILPRRPDDPPLVVAGARMRSRTANRADNRADNRIDNRTGATPTAAAVAAALGEPPWPRTGPQAGPSAIDAIEARRGWSTVDGLTGTVCPDGWLQPTEGFAVEVTGPDDRLLGRWEGGGRLDRLRGCRRFEIPLPDLPGRSAELSRTPVRVRLLVRDAGSAARWSELAWRVRRPETPPAPRSDGPATRSAPPKLVVLYVPDALRADHVGHLGGPEGVSPTLDRLAAEGFTFRRHRSNAPNTLPSIRELFTGRIYLTQRSWDLAGSTRPTLAELFRAAGYRTGLFSGNLYAGPRYGLARGFDHVSRESLFSGAPEVNRNAERVHAAARSWLETVPPDEPVFLYVQTIHPHNPFAPPERFERRFAGGIPSSIRGDTATLKAISRGEREPSAADRERLGGLYAASLAYNDEALGSFLDTLADRTDPEETLVIVTSDHGEELFDHGGVLHGYTLYEELLQIPLVVWGPGRIRPGEASTVTDMLDLHATLLDWTRRWGRRGERGNPPQARSSGRSLLPLLTGSAAALPEEPSFAATWGVPGGIFAIRDGAWKMIRVRGTPETWWMGVGPARTHERHHLFDLSADPGEQRDLSGSGGVREQWLRARLRAWIAHQEEIATGTAGQDSGDGAEPAAEEPLDQEARERLRALGYLD